jgi:DNA-directed RNA polymerase specialized sigma24 family protein
LKRISNKETTGRLDRPDAYDFTVLVDARDFLRVHLPKLSVKQRGILLAWSAGASCREIAHARGISDRAVGRLLMRGLDRLRELGRAAR